MESPCNESECKSTHSRRKGNKKGKHNYICVKCDRQSIADDESQVGELDELQTYVKKHRQNLAVDSR